MPRTCKECGSKFEAKKQTSTFCSTKCRKDFNNRRMTRGAALYDAMMNLRYDRKQADANDIDYTFLCRMAEMFRAEDNNAREGRKSYRPASAIREELGAMVNARHGRI